MDNYLTQEQQDNINTFMAVFAPGTRFGRIRVSNAKRWLNGEGLTAEQINALLDGRTLEIKQG